MSSDAAIRITTELDDAGLLGYEVDRSEIEKMQSIIDAAMEPERKAAEALAKFVEWVRDGERMMTMPDGSQMTHAPTREEFKRLAKEALAAHRTATQTKGADDVD